MYNIWPNDIQVKLCFSRIYLLCGTKLLNIMNEPFLIGSVLTSFSNFMPVKFKMVEFYKLDIFIYMCGLNNNNTCIKKC